MCPFQKASSQSRNTAEDCVMIFPLEKNAFPNGCFVKLWVTADTISEKGKTPPRQLKKWIGDETREDL